jgi:hypothetical protein
MISWFVVEREVVEADERDPSREVISTPTVSLRERMFFTIVRIFFPYPD